MRRAGAVTRAVKGGAGLEAAAIELARRIDDPDTPPSAVAACVRELRALLVAIDAATGSEEARDDLDELAERRRARRNA